MVGKLGVQGGEAAMAGGLGVPSFTPTEVSLFEKRSAFADLD